MTNEQITLIKSSFEKVGPVAEEAGVLFYARLFALDPSLRALFKIDILEQGHKLMQIIGIAVESVDRLEDLVPRLRELGSIHVDYGAKEAHYDTVGEALLWTLRKALNDEYTSPMNDAWTAFYAILSGAMKQGARQRIES